MNAEVEHKTCPFCASSNVEWCNDDTDYRWTMYFIVCNNCECRTGSHDCIDDAWKAWDRRDQ